MLRRSNPFVGFEFGFIYYCFFGLSLFLGCSSKLVNQGSDSQIPSPMMSDFYIQMPVAERKTFLETIKKLRVGDSFVDVLKDLGKPVKERKIRGKKIDDPVRGTAITYFLQKKKKEIENEILDQYVSIAFGNDQKILNISTNVEGVFDNLIYSSGQMRIWSFP